MKPQRTWRLRSHLVGRLLVNMGAVFVLVGAAVMLWRAQVIGRIAREPGPLRSAQEEGALQAQLQTTLQDGQSCAEAWLIRGDGEAMLAQVFGGPAPALAGQVSIRATTDIGPMRRVEQALRELNATLEARVAQRGGTGPGLHICHNAVVHLLGGTLTVQGTESQGTCFALRLPAQAPRSLQPQGDTWT